MGCQWQWFLVGLVSVSVLVTGKQVEGRRAEHGDNVDHVDDVMVGTSGGRQEGETEQCSMLNHVQSAVIQILNNHYEYGKGIHRLHSTVDTVQKDVSHLKDEVNQVIKKQSSLDTNVLPDSSMEWTASRKSTTSGARFHRASDTHRAGQDNSSSVKLDSMTLGSLYVGLINLTARADAQSEALGTLEKRYKTLRRMVRKVTEDSLQSTTATPAPTTAPNTVRREAEDPDRIIVQQMLTKQRDINAHLEQRLNEMQAALTRALEQLQDGGSSGSSNNQLRHQLDCPSHFIRHFSSCYRFINSSSNWVDAEKRCQAIHQDAHLVSIESKEEANFLVKYRLHNRAMWTSHYVWTGGNDLMEEGSWSWVGTGAPVTFTMWKRGEPNNHNTNQHCMYFYSNAYDHSWDDWNCQSARLNYICEIRVSHES